MPGDASQMRTQGPQRANAPAVAESLHDRFSRLNRQLRSVDLPGGLTQERLSALSVIDAHGPISVTALADHERVRPATMSRMVSALEADGHVKRLDDKTDGRGVLVAVTPRGRKMFAKAQQLRLQQLCAALAALPPEQVDLLQQLATTLEQLTDILDKPQTG
jgi:DNA-binding MarR family transcriptional regulator